MKLKQIWNSWKEISSHIGDFQARLLLNIFYFTIVTPFGIITRLFMDPLMIRNNKNSGWVDREQSSNLLNDAKRQF